MKRIIFAAIMFAISVANLHAAVVCEPSPRGLCCWDIDKQGPYHPINC